MKINIVFLVFFCLLISSCNDIKYKKPIINTYNNSSFEVLLNKASLIKKNQIDGLKVYGNIIIINNNQQNLQFSIKTLSLQIDQIVSSSCYFDSIASIIDNVEVKPGQKTTLKVYWIFENDNIIKTPNDINLLINF